MYICMYIYIYIYYAGQIVTLPPSSLCLPANWPVFSIATFNIPSSNKAAQRWRSISLCEQGPVDPVQRSVCVDSVSRYP